MKSIEIRLSIVNNFENLHKKTMIRIILQNIKGMLRVHVHFACSKSEQQKGSCKHRIIYVQFKDILAEADTSSFCARKFGKTQKILIPFDSPVNFLL